MERGGSIDWEGILSTAAVSSKPSSLYAREPTRPEASRWPPEAPRQEAGHRNRPPPRRRSLGAFPARDSFRLEGGGWENAAPYATSNVPPLNGGAAVERGRIRDEAAEAAKAVIFSVSVPAWDLRRTLKIEAKAEHFQRVIEKIHALVQDVKSWDKSAEVLKDLSREEAFELGEEYRERMRLVERRLEALELGEKQRAMLERRRSLEEAEGEGVLARLLRQKEPEDRSPTTNVLESTEPDRRGSRHVPPSSEEAGGGSATRISASGGRPGSKQGPPSEGVFLWSSLGGGSSRRGSKTLQEESRRGSKKSWQEGPSEGTAGSLERLPPALSSHESRRGSRQGQERAQTAVGRSRPGSKESAVSEVGELPTATGSTFLGVSSFEQGKTTDPEKLALATAVVRLEGELKLLKADHEKEKSQLEAGLKAAEQRRVQAELRAKVMLVQEKVKVSSAAQTDFDDEKKVDLAQLRAFVEAFEEAAQAYRGEEDRRQQREAFIDSISPKYPSDRRQQREDGGGADPGATPTTVGADTFSPSAAGSRPASKTRAAADHDASDQQSAGLLEILGNTSLKI